MNEERTGKYLQQVEHIRGHLWHTYFVTVNQEACLSAANLCQGNPERNRRFWNIGSTERYIMWLTECIYKFDVLFTNNQSRG